MTALADSREEAFAIADSYADFRGVHRAFELAWAHTQVELRQLHLTPAETHLFQRLATHFLFVSPVLRPASAVVAGNRQGQADLWRLGLSGDLPIVLVRINSAEHLPLARQVVAAHSFWRLKGLSVDLVILNEEIGGYFEELQHQLQLLLRASEDRGLVDKPGGVFLALRLAFVARRPILCCRRHGALRFARQPRFAWRATRPPGTDTKPRRTTDRVAAGKSDRGKPGKPPDKLVFDNGYGGFKANGREYIVRLSAAMADIRCLRSRGSTSSPTRSSALWFPKAAAALPGRSTAKTIGSPPGETIPSATSPARLFTFATMPVTHCGLRRRCLAARTLISRSGMARATPFLHMSATACLKS